ncbi:hypothetical protein PHYPSEUDO_014743 [Phytophthora pseudosyringae]|uniref:Cyclic nucleotide-binding domain-containing protein n=1 Tax=Phytophthora pseudosyringae TaxID=221518 RepID=A0A8T1W5D9_9STRA|nr:hypothetical protein PHYPSEUDO_014743 [Phytophthora pseudosyringae]
MAAPRKGGPKVQAESPRPVASSTSGLPASLQPTRVSLLLRGQNREQHFQQKSVVKAAQQCGGRQGQLYPVTSRRLSATAFTRSTRSVLAAGDDHLDEILKGVADSINSPDHLPRSDKDALVLQAVLGLWTSRQEARGFRRWKESTLNRVDLQALIAAGVDVHEEARQLLLAAETKRRMLANERQTSIGSDNGKWMAANFSFAESDLLLAWARHTQPKTFRGVDDNTVREALRYLRFRQYQDGESIFFQGDKGDVFYLLLDGSVGIYGAKRAQQPDKQKRSQSVRGDSAARQRGSANNTREKPDMSLMGPRMFTYRTGESFGETALFTNAAVRTATAIAFGAPTTGSSTGSVCELGELSRGVYSRTLKKFHQHFFTQAQRVNFTQRVFLFRDWPRARVVEVAEVLELRRISFGSVLLTEGVSPLSHCFFVLSGSVTVTTQVEIISHADDDPPSTPSAATLKKARRRAHLSIELHTVRVGEIVALESLLEEDDSADRVTYTVVGGSADVEVYALNRSEGRAFLASSTVNVAHQIQSLCASEHAHREQRIEDARRALGEREAINKKHRLELENEAFELGLTDKQQHHRQKQHELDELNQLSSHDTSRGPIGLQRPFLPHLDPVKLLGGVDENKPADIPRRVLSQGIEIDTSLGVVAVPPKMLSTLAKNFIVRDWDTLADDYAQRLTLQLPVRSPLSPLLLIRVPPSMTCRSETMPPTQMHTARRRRAPATMSARFHDERQARDAHMRQLSMDYDAKMHWDPEKKSFVLLQALPSHKAKRQPLQARAFGSSNALISTDPSRQPEGGEAAAQDLRLEQVKLHDQLQTSTDISTEVVR